MVLGICCVHHTDEIAASSSVLVVAPCCDAVVNVFSPIHCWAGGPPPADVGHSSTSHWSSGQGCGWGSGCVCSGQLGVVQVDCSYAGCTRRSWWASWAGRARETITAISSTEQGGQGSGRGQSGCG